ncbi:helix-turn-helix domain-containing protein [Thioclava sp. GXIMD2076]|uniref:helix-turn-helix domain-containing protein n=1 Tax=Thioclava sp. GXIMD2076 TaxID=3131931 RepID=UPI0030D5E5AF
MPDTSPPALPETQQTGHFVQTDRATHEAWMQLTIQAPKASAVLHLLANRVGEHNAVVASYPVLAEVSGLSVSTIRRAIATLIEGNWIEVRRLGPSSTVNAYVLNDRVAWTRARNDLRYSLFSATVLASETEQEDRERLGNLEPLRKLPRTGETQIPSGAGLPPVSQPFFDGLEPDLPSTGDNGDKK